MKNGSWTEDDGRFETLGAFGFGWIILNCLAAILSIYKDFIGWISFNLQDQPNKCLASSSRQNVWEFIGLQKYQVVREKNKLLCKMLLIRILCETVLFLWNTTWSHNQEWLPLKQDFSPDFPLALVYSSPFSSTGIFSYFPWPVTTNLYLLPEGVPWENRDWFNTTVYYNRWKQLCIDTFIFLA